jgi:hypothetical protein
MRDKSESRRGGISELRGFQSASELYRLSDRHRSANFSANLCG